MTADPFDALRAALAPVSRDVAPLIVARLLAETLAAADPALADPRLARALDLAMAPALAALARAGAPASAAVWRAPAAAQAPRPPRRLPAAPPAVQVGDRVVACVRADGWPRATAAVVTEAAPAIVTLRLPCGRLWLAPRAALIRNLTRDDAEARHG